MVGRSEAIGNFVVEWIGDWWRLARAGFALARRDALFPRQYRDRLPALLRFGAAIASFGVRADSRLGLRLAQALEELGPAFIKLGQFLATRPDLIGVEAAQDLSGLKDRVRPFSLEQAKAILVAELGDAAGGLSPLQPPVASASIAQVHKVSVRDTGNRGIDAPQTLALKILRPHIGRTLQRDFRALRRGARFLEKFVPQSRRLEPVALIDVVAREAERECDLRLEAGSADELAGYYRADGYASAPRIDWHRTTKQILAMEWMSGRQLTDPEAFAAGPDGVGLDRKQLAASVICTFLASALDHGMFHADFHEGNLIVQPDGQLGVVDFGIVGRLGPAERRYLAEILWGFIQRDYRRLAEVHFEAGYVPAHHSVAEFASALRSVGEPIFGLTADQVSMSQLLLHLWDVTHFFDMRLRKELVLLQKTMVQAEGVARSIDPQLDIWKISRPIVEAWMKRELGPRGQVQHFWERAKKGLQALDQLPDRLAQWPAATASDDRASSFSRDRRSAHKLAAPLWWIAIALIALAASSIWQVLQNR